MLPISSGESSSRDREQPLERMGRFPEFTANWHYRPGEDLRPFAALQDAISVLRFATRLLSTRSSSDF
jgi:hypothetical protein